MASRLPLALIRYSHPHTDQNYLLHIADYVSNLQCDSEFCEMYTEYSCCRKCHVNLYNTLQMHEKFLSSLYSKTLQKRAESRSYCIL